MALFENKAPRRLAALSAAAVIVSYAHGWVYVLATDAKLEDFAQAVAIIACAVALFAAMAIGPASV